MEFTIHSDIALKALSKLSSIFSRNTIISIDADIDRVIFYGTDARYALSCSIPADINKGGSSAINLHILHDLIKHGVGMWKIKCEDNFTLEYSSGKYNIPIAKNETHADLNTNQHKVLWNLAGNTINKMLKESIIAAGEQVYDGIYIHYDNEHKCIAAAATDGARMSCSRYYVDAEPAEVMISKDTASLLIRWIEDHAEVKFYIGGISDPIEVMWQSQNILYGLKASTMQCKFPQYQKAIPSDGQTITIDSQELLRALQRNTIFSNNKQILLQPDGEYVLLKSSSLDIGSGNEKIPATCSVNAAAWRIESKILTDALSVGSVTLQGTERGPIKIERQGWVYLFMPIERSRI